MLKVIFLLYAESFCHKEHIKFLKTSIRHKSVTVYAIQLVALCDVRCNDKLSDRCHKGREIVYRAEYKKNILTLSINIRSHCAKLICYRHKLKFINKFEDQTQWLVNHSTHRTCVFRLLWGNKISELISQFRPSTCNSKVLTLFRSNLVWQT